MRTKTVLLTAAISAAGVATSMAQGSVFSVNAVGYVNTKVPAGKFALISNPLDAGAGNNTIANLFKGVAAGTQVFKYDGKAFATATYDDIDNAFLPASAAALEVNPGEGVFIRNAGSQELQITFVGEVKQGTLNNPLPAGLSIRSSIVPQAGDVKALGLQGAPGDQIFKFVVAKQSYDVFGFDDLENNWLPSVPTLEVGEAFFLRKNAAGTWTRTFSVN